MSVRRRLLPAAVLTAVLLAGCGRDDEDSAAGSTASPTTSAPAEAATTSPPVETGVATPDGGSSGQPDGPGTRSSRPAADSSSQPDTGALEPNSPGWPIEAPPVHGAQRLAVYPVVAPAGDPSLQQALDDVRQGWAGASIRELGCDAGAPEALGRDPSEHAVAVHFEMDEQVAAFARLYGKPFLGPVQVTTYCLD